MTIWKIAAAAALATIGATQPVMAATLVNIQFTGPQRQVSTQVGAGVVGSAGDSWNQLFGNVGTASLNTTRNAASGYSISYSADGAYASEASYTQFTGTPYANLMQGYLYGGGTPITATISGLRANEAFTLHAITQGDNNSNGRRNDLTVNGQTASTTNSNTNRFIEGDNFAVFSGRANALGQIVLSDVRGAGEANLNGLQLAAGVPEPATWAMMIIGIGGVGVAMRRQRTKDARQLRFA